MILKLIYNIILTNIIMAYKFKNKELAKIPEEKKRN